MARIEFISSLSSLGLCFVTLSVLQEITCTEYQAVLPQGDHFISLMLLWRNAMHLQ